MTLQLSRFNPPGLPKHVAEDIDLFTGREWLLPQVLKWWDQRDERLLLLTGDPGTGKSMVLAWLANFGPEPENALTRKQLTRLRHLTKAAYFCDADSRNVAPKAFADSIGNQLTSTIEGFDDAFAATLAERVQITGTAHATSAASGATLIGNQIGNIDLGMLGDEMSFDRAFIEPLKRLYSSGYDKPALLLVDALDEAQTYTGVTLPDLLSRLDDLPAPVRILASTRDDPRVLKLFHSSHRIDLIDDAEPGIDDIRTYTNSRLVKIAATDQAELAEFAKRLTEKASGIFLYAKLVLDEVFCSSVKLPHLAEYPLPADLSRLYHRFITREVGKDEQRWYDHYEPFLGLVSIAQGIGLTTQQLNAIIGKDIRVLLRTSKQYLSGDLPDGPFRPFHRSFAEFLLEDESNIDYHIDSQFFHRQIVDYYWKVCSDGWENADDYCLRHLTFHLEKAHRVEQLHALLKEGHHSSKRSKNSWCNIKEAAGQLDEYVTDIERAWRLASGKAGVGLQVRYALITSSLRETSAAIPACLLELCVQEKILTWRQAVHSARLRRSPTARAYILARIASHIPPQKRQILEEELAAVVALSDAGQRGSALAELAPVLPDRLIGDLLSAAKTATSDDHKEKIVLALTPRFIGEHFDAARNIVGFTKDSLHQIRCLAALASSQRRLESQTRFEELLAEIRARIVQMAPAHAKVIALCELARFESELQEETIERALAIVRNLNYSQGLACALAAFGSLGATVMHDRHVAELLDLATRTYREEDSPGIGEAYTAALSALGPLLSDNQRVFFIRDRVKKLEAAGTWFGRQFARHNVPFLISYLPVEEQSSAFLQYLPCLVKAVAQPDEFSFASIFAAFLSVPTPPNWRRAAALDALGKLPKHLLTEALKATSEVRSDEGRAHVLTILVPQLTRQRRKSVLQSELDRVRCIGDEAAQGNALAALVGYLPKEMQAEIAEVALIAIEGHDKYFSALALLAPHLSPDRSAKALSSALEAARAIDDDGRRARVLAKLVPALAPEKILNALENAPAPGRWDYLVLAPLVSRLPREQRQDRIAEVFEAIQTDVVGELPEYVVNVLREIASELNDDQVEAALELIGKIDPNMFLIRSDALCALAPRLLGSQLDRALSMARDLRDSNGLSYVRAVASLAKNITDYQSSTALLQDAHEVARSLDDYEARARALVAVAQSLPDRSILSAALASARSIGEDNRRAIAIDVLLPHLNGAEQLEALECMLRSCLGTEVSITIGATRIRKGIVRAFLLERIAGPAAQAIESTGCKLAAVETASAIRETGAWWP